jgi:nucleotide-binding universal stress UspA family protein
MEVNKILWPTDLSEESKQVLPVLRSQAEQYGATVVVLHVMDDVVRVSNLAQAMNHDEAVRFSELLRSDAETKLDDMCQLLGDSCPMFEKHVAEGDPSEEILGFIEAQGIDLVVMGTHTGHAKKTISSAKVAREVVAHTPVPVLAVPIS